MADWRTALAALAALATLAQPARAQDPAPPAADPAPNPATDPATADEAAPPAQLAWMGTGNIAGVYFSVGVALCRLANQHRPATGIRCAATPTAGSVDNLTRLRSGSLQLAIVQSDTLADAGAGSGSFAAAGPMPELRAVMGLYDEPLAIVARPDAGIAAIPDLAGKRVSLGENGSGTRAVAEATLAAFGLDPAAFPETPPLAPDRLGQALCQGQIDAFLYAVGQPALPIQEATASCGAQLIPATGPAVDTLLAANPAMIASEIPGGLYAGAAAATPTVGVKATLATTAAVPDDVVGTIVSSALDDMETLRGLDPVLARLEPEAMASGGLTAPLHPAAETLYRDHGLLP